MGEIGWIGEPLAPPPLTPIPGIDDAKHKAEEIIEYGKGIIAGLLPGIIDFEIPDQPDIVDPTLPNPFEFNEAEYLSVFQSTISALLLNELQNGGYGLNPLDEEDLWNRARDREAVNSAAVMEEIKASYAMQGFPVAPGAMNKAIERAAKASMEKNSSVNREISLKRADLYWEGKKFAFEQARGWESLFREFYNAVMTRTLEAAKQRVIVGIEMMKAQIELAKYKVQMAIEFSKLGLGIAVAEIEAQARVTAAALSMMNFNASIANHFSASMSESVNASVSTQSSQSDSVSQSAQTSVIHETIVRE